MVKMMMAVPGEKNLRTPVHVALRRACDTIRRVAEWPAKRCVTLVKMFACTQDTLPQHASKIACKAVFAPPVCVVPQKQMHLT